MLQFRLFGIPIGVDWWFWITGILLGGGIGAKNFSDWIEVGVKVGVIFVSVLVHELAHALVGRRFGVSPSIALHGFGGSTFLPGAQFTRGQSILVSGAGPLAGLALGSLIHGTLLVLKPNLPPLGEIAVQSARYINFAWSLFNLLPIQPLDGGQILREVLGPNRLKITAAIGGVLAAALCAWSLRNGMLIMGFFLAMLAYHNFRRDPVEGGVIKG